MKVIAVLILSMGMASADTLLMPPNAVPPPADGSVGKGTETDQMRANDAPCLAKMKAQTPPLLGMAEVRFMAKCKANGPDSMQ